MSFKTRNTDFDLDGKFDYANATLGKHGTEFVLDRNLFGQSSSTTPVDFSNNTTSMNPASATSVDDSTGDAGVGVRRECAPPQKRHRHEHSSAAFFDALAPCRRRRIPDECVQGVDAAYAYVETANANDEGVDGGSQPQYRDPNCGVATW